MPAGGEMKPALVGGVFDSLARGAEVHGASAQSSFFCVGYYSRLGRLNKTSGHSKRPKRPISSDESEHEIQSKLQRALQPKIATAPAHRKRVRAQDTHPRLIGDVPNGQVVPRDGHTDGL